LVLIVDLHKTKSRPEAFAVVRGRKVGPSTVIVDVTLRNAAKIFVAWDSIWLTKLVVLCEKVNDKAKAAVDDSLPARSTHWPSKFVKSLEQVKATVE
jgi:hypothetical protein